MPKLGELSWTNQQLLKALTMKPAQLSISRFKYLQHLYLFISIHTRFIIGLIILHLFMLILQKIRAYSDYTEKCFLTLYYQEAFLFLMNINEWNSLLYHKFGHYILMMEVSWLLYIPCLLPLVLE